MRLSKSPLAVCALALLLVLAGCNGGGGDATPSPTLQPLTDDETETATPSDGQNPSVVEPDDVDDPETAAFVREARARNITLREVRLVDGLLQVAYDIDDSSSDAMQRQAVELSVAYANVVNRTWETNASWNTSGMAATAVNDAGQPVARFRMPAYWGRQVKNDFISRDDFGERIGETYVTAADENFAEPSDNLTQFGRGVAATTDGNVVSLDQSRDVVFLTMRVETSNQTVQQREVLLVSQVYGGFINESWDTTALQITLYGPDGDLVGWVRVPPDRALGSFQGISIANRYILNRFVLEGDNLQGDR